MAVLFVFSMVSTSAQNAVSTGTITACVRDGSGGVVPGVAVSVTSNETGLEFNGTTNSDGRSNYPVMMVGRYTLRARHDGFKITEVRNVVVQVGQTTVINVELAIGPVAQRVLVEATPLLFRPSESSVSTVVSREFIEELPLSGRRYTDFVLLAANVHADGDTGQLSIGGQQGSSDSGYHNGNGADSFTVDGASATSSFFGAARGGTNVPYIFGEQSIQEFQVAVIPYSAAYGGAGSGFINTVTKSGADSFHGDAFYYLRHSATGANDAVDKANGVPKPLNVLQQFGADLGGPLVKRKWFYFDYEQQRQKDPVSTVDPNVDESLFLNVAPDTALPAPNALFPVPSGFGSAPTLGDPNYPTYLQQVSNALNAIKSSLGQLERRRDDLVLFSKLDWQPTTGDHFNFVYNYSRFDSPAGLFAFNPVAGFGLSALPSDYVRDHHASVNWTHAFDCNLFNDLRVSFLRDDQTTKPSALIDHNFPSVVLLSIASGFLLGNAPDTPAVTREYEWEFGERLDWTRGRHNLQAGFDITRTHVTDFSPGLSPGFYGFFTLADFATGAYAFYLQSVGQPLFPLTVPYYGFFVQDKFRASRHLTLNIGLREEFQVFPQPEPSPAFSLAGQYPNQYRRLAPRFGFAYEATSRTVVRGGFGLFREQLNGVNYENSVITNGAPNRRTNVLSLFDSTQPADQQSPVFPYTLSGVSPPPAVNISLVHPDFRTPYVLAASLEVQRNLGANTAFSVGTMWTHGVHLISSSAYDLNLKPPFGATSYIVCPPGTTTVPCFGRTVVLPNLDAVLLEGQEGAIDPNLGQINALISPGRNHYNSLYAQLQRHVSSGLGALVSYTFSKNIESNGVDFNNQFDFSNTHGPSLLDQRHRLSVAAIYESGRWRGLSPAWRTLLSDWTLSTVTQFNSGRPYAGVLNTSCASSTLSFDNCDGLSVVLNDSATLQSTGNTALGIGGNGPSPAVGLHSFYGPWIVEVDLGVARTVSLHERHTLTFKAQAFNLLNRANFHVQNGVGVNAIQYNPIGTTCGDGMTLQQLCYLVPNLDFGKPQSISHANGPRTFQFAIEYHF